MEIQLIADGIVLNTRCEHPLMHIPPVHGKVLYKTFRENENMSNPVFDITYIVSDVFYEVQETWNDGYNSVVKVYLEELSRVEIKK